MLGAQPEITGCLSMLCYTGTAPGLPGAIYRSGLEISG